MACHLPWRLNGSDGLETSPFDLDGPMTEEAKIAVSFRYDRRFDAASAGAVVDDERDSATKALEHMFRAARANRPARVGRWSGKGPSGCFQQSLDRSMARNPKPNSRETGCDNPGDGAFRLQRG